jgi:hypothetical protein
VTMYMNSSLSISFAECFVLLLSNAYDWMMVRRQCWSLRTAGIFFGGGAEELNLFWMSELLGLATMSESLHCQLFGRRLGAKPVGE